MANDLDYHVEILTNRLKKRSKHLSTWARRNDVSCYRLYDRDIPEVPLVVDRYEDYLHVAQFEAPHKRLPVSTLEYGERMREAARRALGIRDDRAFLKVRRRTPRGRQYERVAERGVTTVVREGGLLFEANLSDYLDTGLFLDHRETRRLCRQFVEKLRSTGRVAVLNLFSYTGSFTVYAAAAGAAPTVSVDMSRTYSAWAARNLGLNGMADRDHGFISEDVFAYLSGAHSRPQRYQLIILDPPTFSNSKRMSRSMDLQRDHPELLRTCEGLLAPGGVILFSTNRRGFTLAETLGRLRATDITSRTIPPDFRNRKVHQCWLLCRGPIAERLLAGTPPGGYPPAGRGPDSSSS